jgi:hypothetical protein
VKAYRRLGWAVVLSPMLLGAAPAEVPSTWHLVKTNDGGTVKCRMESEKAPVNDGYQNVMARIIVTSANVVQIVSESTFDAGSGDIGIQVDQKPLVKMDKLQGEKTVVFEGAAAAALIPEFKLGLKARAQLRFWPTWPVTGPHDAEFSLIGFTKTYDEMTGNCR